MGEYFRLIGHEIDQVEEEKHIVCLSNKECEELLDKSKKVYYSQRPI